MGSMTEQTEGCGPDCPEYQPLQEWLAYIETSGLLRFPPGTFVAGETVRITARGVIGARGEPTIKLPFDEELPSR
jgi:hypothetical protein